MKKRAKLSLLLTIGISLILVSFPAVGHWCSCFPGCWTPNAYACVYPDDETPEYDPDNEWFSFDMYIEQFASNEGCPVEIKGVRLLTCPDNWPSCCGIFIPLDDFSLYVQECEKNLGPGWNDCDGDEFSYQIGAFSPSSFLETDDRNRGCSYNPSDTLREKTHANVRIVRTVNADPGDYRLIFRAEWDPDVYQPPPNGGAYVTDSYLDSVQMEINIPSGAPEDCQNNVDDDSDGLIDCQDTLECPTPCSGNCDYSYCNPGTYDWECSASQGLCTGNCDECSGSGNTYNCQASSALCTGNCDVCSGSGTTYNCQASPVLCTGNCDVCSGSGTAYSCQANSALCTGNCDTCSGSDTTYDCQADHAMCIGDCDYCSGSGTTFNCQADEAVCDVCSDCTGSGVNYNCNFIEDGAEDTGCSWPGFCCSGTCVTAPGDYGSACGGDECSGQIECMDTEYMGHINMTDIIFLMHLDKDPAYGESETFMYDFSGRANHGTCTNCPIWTATGKLGGGFEFDGSGNKITSADIPEIDYALELTAAAWIKPYDSSGGAAVLKWDETPLSDKTFLLNIFADESGNPIASVHEDDSSGSSYAEVRSDFSVQPGQWYHLAMTFVADSPTGLRLYIDGVEDPNSPLSTTSIARLEATAIPVTIGVSDDGYYPFTGAIDEVAVWNRALPAQEIQDLYDLQRAKYKCSTMDDTCAYCAGDTGYSSSCSRDGECSGGTSSECNVCDQCVDTGSSVTCQSYAVGYDSTDPYQCLDDGTGCTAMSCICDGIGSCVSNVAEDCADGLDNDGDGYTDCQDSDCPTICSGNCVNSDCNPVTYEWECSVDPGSCTGNCDECSGSGTVYNCQAVPALCNGDCSICSGSGNMFNCQADELLCSVCSDCSGSGNMFSCSVVTDGSDDTGCTGGDFCCSGSCVTTAPGDYGSGCGGSECSGQVQCDGTNYMCSTMDDTCAYCTGDIGYTSTCSRDGDCSGGTSSECDVCDQCVDTGSSVTCQSYAAGYDTANPYLCTDDGTGCAATSCICDGSGTCISNAAEDCLDGLDNDGDGYIDCQDSDCPTICSGNCQNSVCNPGTYEWECSADPGSCTGNCDECTGGGTVYNCQANSALCNGDCSVCAGSDTSFNCEGDASQCSVCSDCSGSGNTFSCSVVPDGSDDTGCSGSSFCCSGSCITTAPADYGSDCGNDECYGTVQCDGTNYRCSTIGSSCAYCSGDTGYTSTCSRDGSCVGGSGLVCDVCDQCLDLGSSVTCQSYAIGYDTTDPYQCLDDGTGCAGTVCICDGTGSCIPNAAEDCLDGLDNDGDGYIDCQDSDCPATCSGNCVNSICNPGTYEWECSADSGSCTGNCDECTGSGTVYNCQANSGLCNGDCSACAGSGTSFNCEADESQCSVCNDCSGSGNTFSCSTVPDGSDDSVCAGSSFCCGGNCITTAPADHGLACGNDECSGTVQCDSTDYRCSTMGSTCAYCSGDTGYASTCSRDGGCAGGTASECDVCDQCLDSGSSTACQPYAFGYDSTSPHLCLGSGTGCADSSCICDGSGNCIDNANENCNDNADNDDDGLIDCQDSDCPHELLGNCEIAVCNEVTYDWEYGSNSSGCTGNCDVCSLDSYGRYNCRAEDSICTGNCDVCSGSGTDYNCQANSGLCNGDCSACAGSGTSFYCEADESQCSVCSDCSGSGAFFSCSIIPDGTDDTGCSGASFCCSGNCINSAPGDYGSDCGGNECSGTVECDGANFRCSTMGALCAYCQGDTGYASSCGRDGDCSGGTPSECDVCDQCLDLGSSVTCQSYAVGYDTTDPYQCLDDGTGCAGTSCICDGSSSCIPNAAEDCGDGLDNDGDGNTDCQDSDCPAPCSGTCADSVCNPGTYEWECSADPSYCTGNCDECTGSGTVYNCQANSDLCGGDCSICFGSGTSFNCEGDESQCSTCSDCSGSGTTFSCSIVADGSDDAGCTGDDFCCSGTCVDTAPGDFGTDCGSDECDGTMGCDGTGYRCSTMGNACAYCSGDTGYTSTCSQDGECLGGSPNECAVCTSCYDSGTIVACEDYPFGYDQTDPNQCLADGTGCAGESCICDGVGFCNNNANENCNDDSDNDGDGYIDCEDTDCPTPCSGTCINSVCNPGTYDWECSSAADLCTGNCDECIGSGNLYNCQANPVLCSGDCSICAGSSTSFNCQAEEDQCSVCSDCSGSGNTFSCSVVTDGSDDAGCSGDSFCCNGNCVEDAPADFGSDCGNDECYGTIQCDGTAYRCSQMGGVCAYCAGDRGFVSTCNQEGLCLAGSSEECDDCNTCTDLGTSVACIYYDPGTYDTTDPNLCMFDGIGCLGDSCICDGLGNCTNNANEDCNDNADNDGDGLIDCQDSDCPHETLGNCENALCNEVTHAWEYEGDDDMCTGNCDVCALDDGRYNCRAEQALCSGVCSICDGSGTDFDCGPDQSQCDACYDCSFTGTDYNCSPVADGLDDDVCSGTGFCCGGVCITSAPGDYGDSCGNDESCFGQIYCNGADYECSTLGDSCAYCDGDTGNEGTCDKDGSCSTDTTTECEACNACIDSGSVISCDPYAQGQDSVFPNECLLDGTGCTQQSGSCICNGIGDCILIENEDCNDDIDNDFDGLIDCQDSDCPHENLGNCEAAVCGNNTYDWVYSGNDSHCTGNCDVCALASGRYNCRAEQSLCNGDCSSCVGNGTEFSCAANESRCETCLDCVVNSNNYSCQFVNATTDDGCSGDDFCCNGNCVTNAPSGYGEDCGDDACNGTIMCNGTTYRCSAEAGPGCANCDGDSGYSGTCTSSGTCDPTDTVTCPTCERCEVDGLEVTCSDYQEDHEDRAEPNTCTSDGAGCSADSCICDGSGDCISDEVSDDDDDDDDNGGGSRPPDIPPGPTACTLDCGPCGVCELENRIQKCVPEDAMCLGDCSECALNGTQYHCRAKDSACPVCNHCSGSGTRYNCYRVRDGLEDAGCSEPNFCCGGNCIENAPSAFGDKCGSDENCLGLMECNGTSYRCSTSGNSCAYCNNDVGYTSTCDISGACIGGEPNVCDACTECTDLGIFTKCDYYGMGHDTTSPNLCTVFGEGCSGASCICYQGGCVANDDEDTPDVDTYWNQTEANVGERVKLVLDLPQCVMQDVAFNVYEAGLSKQGNAQNQPEDIRKEDCSIVSSWKAEYVRDTFDLFNFNFRPEFRFTASFDNQTVMSSNLLTILRHDEDKDSVSDNLDCNDYDPNIGECTGCGYCSDIYEVRGECIVDEALCKLIDNKSKFDSVVQSRMRNDTSISAILPVSVRLLDRMNISPVVSNNGNIIINNLKIVLIEPDGTMQELNYPVLGPDSDLETEFNVQIPYIEYADIMTYELKVYSNLELIARDEIEIFVKKSKYIVAYRQHNDTLDIITIINNLGSEKTRGYELEFDINSKRSTVFTDLIAIGEIDSDSMYQQVNSYNLAHFPKTRKEYDLNWRMYKDGRLVTKNTEKIYISR